MEERKKGPVDNLPLPNWVDLDAWAEFVDMRKRKKAPLTDRSAARALKRLYELKQAGYDPNASLLQSADHHWVDLYPPKDMTIPKKEATATSDWLAQHEAHKAASQTPEAHAARQRVMALVKPGIKRVA